MHEIRSELEVRARGSSDERRFTSGKDAWCCGKASPVRNFVDETVDEADETEDDTEIDRVL